MVVAELYLKDHKSYGHLRKETADSHMAGRMLEQWEFNGQSGNGRECLRFLNKKVLQFNKREIPGVKMRRVFFLLLRGQLMAGAIIVSA